MGKISLIIGSLGIAFSTYLLVTDYSFRGLILFSVFYIVFLYGFIIVTSSEKEKISEDELN